MSGCRQPSEIAMTRTEANLHNVTEDGDQVVDNRDIDDLAGVKNKNAIASQS
ncbi:hypothetical protein KIN20_019974 [Parelaphostrongylus tenuis]|uniref:Uncharacterized protein n=1 Tax=Parelaphostrongylus tenuis TaxID=148309 RepID=A0AAD5N2S8_PARTN|nr:hypothetical protein KIN20_019974 [Parelaphostrongylus tenuis]